MPRDAKILHNGKQYTGRVSNDGSLLEIDVENGKKEFKKNKDGNWQEVPQNKPEPKWDKSSDGQSIGGMSSTVDEKDKMPVKLENPGMGSYVPDKVPRPIKALGNGIKETVEHGADNSPMKSIEKKATEPVKNFAKALKKALRG